MRKTKKDVIQMYSNDWRSVTGYVCCAAVAWSYLIQPLVVFVLQLCGTHVSAAHLPNFELIGILSGMLGLGTLRSVESVKINKN